MGPVHAICSAGSCSRNIQSLSFSLCCCMSVPDCDCCILSRSATAAPFGGYILSFINVQPSRRTLSRMSSIHLETSMYNCDKIVRILLTDAINTNLCLIDWHKTLMLLFRVESRQTKKRTDWATITRTSRRRRSLARYVLPSCNETIEVASRLASLSLSLFLSWSQKVTRHSCW